MLQMKVEGENCFNFKIGTTIESKQSLTFYKSLMENIILIKLNGEKKLNAE